MKEINKKISLVLLVSYGHSGSTLLDLIMDSHSKVVGVGEIFQYSRAVKTDRICTCMSKVSDCYFWKRVFKGIKILPLKIWRFKIDFLFNRNNFFWLNNGIIEKVNLNKYKNINQKIYSNVLDVSEKEIVFDSSKDPDRAEVFLDDNNFDVSILHLVRDGRGSVYSYMKVHEDWNPFYFMWQWMVTNFRIEIIKFRHKNVKNIFVYYDDLVNNTKVELSRILDFIDLDFEPDMLNFQEKIHHQAGGNLKLRKKVREQIIKKDNRWRKEMKIYHRIIFNLFFGWLNLFYKWK